MPLQDFKGSDSEGETGDALTKLGGLEARRRSVTVVVGRGARWLGWLVVVLGAWGLVGVLLEYPGGFLHWALHVILLKLICA